MTLSTQIANQIREVLLHGTWVATNFKVQLSDVSWEKAATKVKSLNTIADLTFHVNYYLAGLIQVFLAGTLNIRDKYSFDAPSITSQNDWEQRLQKIWSNAETFANLIEQMDDTTLMESFVEEKYGNNYINIQAMIEHCYYHLGQIVLIKKLMQANS
jgi:hypothetical protein